MGDVLSKINDLQVLKEEGENPDTYIFDNAEKKPNAVPSKLTVNIIVMFSN